MGEKLRRPHILENQQNSVKLEYLRWNEQLCSPDRWCRWSNHSSARGLGGGDVCSKVPIPWAWELPLNLPQAQHKSGLERAGRAVPTTARTAAPSSRILAQRGHLRVTVLVGCGTLGLNTLALDGVL